MPAQRVDIKYVRKNADFGSVLADYGVELAGEGDERTAQCPFHKQGTGSFKVNLADRLYNCFGCDAGGNVIDFVMAMDDVDARQAAITVAKICDMPVAEPRYKKSERSSRSRKRSAKAAPANQGHNKKRAPAEQPAEGKADELPPTTNEPLTFELKVDGTHDRVVRRYAGETIDEFGLGLCSRGMMAGRIVVPVHEALSGQVVAYIGIWPDDEVPDDTPRYLLPSKFLPDMELFNLHRLSNPVRAVAIAPHCDAVFHLHAMGIPVVSPLNMAMSQTQMDLLARYGVTHTTVLFDGDDASRTVAEQVTTALARRFFVHAPNVPRSFRASSADAAMVKAVLGGDVSKDLP